MGSRYGVRHVQFVNSCIQGEPWCEDTPERYAYLMTKMTGKEIPKDRLTLLHGIPEGGNKLRLQW